MFMFSGVQLQYEYWQCDTTKQGETGSEKSLEWETTQHLACTDSVDVISEPEYGQLVLEIWKVEKVQYNVLTFWTQMSKVEHIGYNWLYVKNYKNRS